jgi:hypothetical protein
MRNPWVGLRPFTSSESDLFFGRQREAQILGNLVATQPVLVLYAPSGTGKSSLLNAGLIPALGQDEGQVAVVVGSDQEPMAAVRSALAGTGWAVPPGLDLAELMNRFWLDQDRRTVVIIDQFEERINAGQPLEELYAAMTKLSHSRSDAGCVLLSIREDYIGALEPLMRRIPGLMDGSYRVPPLSRVSLESAIHGPLKTLESSISVDETLVQQSLDDLFQRSNLAQEPGEQRFEPGYFQIVWQRLWDDNAERNGRALTLESYRRLGGAKRILKDFTSEILNSLEPAQAQMFWAISRYLVLPTGAKTSLTVDDLTQLLQPTDYLELLTPKYSGKGSTWLTSLTPEQTAGLVRQVLQRLTSSQAPLFQRVIRFGREEYELLHDLLGRILLEWRQEYERATAERMRRTSSELQVSRDRLVKSLKIKDTFASIKHRSRSFRDFDRSSDRYIADFEQALADDFAGIAASEVPKVVHRLVIYKIALDSLQSSLYHLDSRLRREVSSRLDAQVDRFKNNTPIYIGAALEHPDVEIRRTLQNAAAYLTSPTRSYLPTSPFSAPRFVYASVSGLVAAVTSFALAYTIGASIFSALDIQYQFLTIGIFIFFYALFFGFFAMEESSARDGVIKIFAPVIDADDLWEGLRSGLMTWPLPAFYLTYFCLLGAWLFELAGWAATAGFNLAGFAGLFGMLFFALWAWDEL